MDLDTAAATCPECGRAPGAGRFCANCGARVEPRSRTGADGSGGSRTSADAPTGPADPRPADGEAGGVVSTAGTGTSPPRPGADRGRPARVTAVVLLIAVLALAVWLQRPRPREVERAGGLASYGGSTSDDRASLIRERWSVPLSSSPTPAAVDAVVTSPGLTAVVTDEAVWVLSDALDRIEAELPRLRGLPRPDADGRFAVLERDRLLVIDPSTAEVVSRARTDRSGTSVPAWGQPTSAGWAFTEPSTRGGATFVHVSDEGDVWTAEGVDVQDVLQVDDVVVLSAPGEVRAHQVTTGSRAWTVTGAAAVTAGDGVVVVERPGGELEGLSARTGAPVWRRDGAGLLGANAAGVVVEEEAGRLVAIDPTTGSESVRFDAPEGEDGLPLAGSRVLGDQFLAGTRDLVVFDPGGRVRWRVAASDVLGLAAAGDVVVVTTTTGTRVLRGAFGEPSPLVLPPHARAAAAQHPAVSGDRVQPVVGTVVSLVDGSVEQEASGAALDATVFGLADGFWQRHRGRSLVRDRNGQVRWQSGGGTVPVPVADTPHGVVAVLDDGAIGAVRLVDPTTGFAIGPGVLDAGLLRGDPVAPELVIGRWRDRATDETWTVAISVGDDGLEERWRSREVGEVVGATADLVWVHQPGRLVGLDVDGGGQVRVIDTPVIATTSALAEGTAVLVTDGAVVGVPLAGGTAWRVALDARPTASPTVGGDRVHIGLAGGGLLTLDPDGRRVDLRAVGDTDVRSIVVTGRTLLARTASGLVALGD